RLKRSIIQGTNKKVNRYTDKSFRKIPPHFSLNFSGRGGSPTFPSDLFPKSNTNVPKIINIPAIPKPACQLHTCATHPHIAPHNAAPMLNRQQNIETALSLPS